MEWFRKARIRVTRIKINVTQLVRKLSFEVNQLSVSRILLILYLGTISIYWNWLKYPIFYVVLNRKFFLTIPNFGCLSSSNSLLLMSSWESICALPPVPLILFQFKLLSWILLFLNTTLIRPVWSSNTSVVCGK